MISQTALYLHVDLAIYFVYVGPVILKFSENLLKENTLGRKILIAFSL